MAYSLESTAELTSLADTVKTRTHVSQDLSTIYTLNDYLQNMSAWITKESDILISSGSTSFTCTTSGRFILILPVEINNIWQLVIYISGVGYDGYGDIQGIDKWYLISNDLTSMTAYSNSPFLKVQTNFSLQDNTISALGSTAWVFKIND